MEAEKKMTLMKFQYGDIYVQVDDSATERDFQLAIALLDAYLWLEIQYKYKIIEVEFSEAKT